MDLFNFKRTLPLKHQTRTVYLKGLWQSHQAAQEVEAELRSELALRDQARGQNLEVARQMHAARNPVSLHLRRGDYGIEYGEDSMLKSEYYARAIAHMKERLRDLTLFIFSDDPQCARQFASGHPGSVVVDHNDAQSAHEDLRLMSLCQHHIIANSTFSWWGAWLNPRPHKVVIAPSRWLGFKTSETDIAPPNWLIL